MAAASDASLKLLQWNVFEDGLTDSPGAIGLSSEFDQRFSALLAALCENADGVAFHVFGATRNFAQMPPVTKLNSSSCFFEFIDVMYNCIYHTLGGEARFGDAAPGDKPDLMNTLRSIFLKTTLADPAKPPSASNPWSLTHLDFELDKAVGQAAGRSPELNTWADRVRRTGQEAFDGTLGTLTWQRPQLEGMWKRQGNVFWDKIWLDMSFCMQPHVDVDPATKQALGLYRRAGAPTDFDFSQPLPTFVETILDDTGVVSSFRTLTLQAAMWRLLLALFEHAGDRPLAAEALGAFMGLGLSEATSTVSVMSMEERASMVFAALHVEVLNWFERAALDTRSRLVMQRLAAERPSLVTLVEYNEPWRRVRLPDGQNYAAVTGRGQAAILYDQDVFECVASDAVPGFARSDKDHAPKSSCFVLLRHTSSGLLVVVGAFHFESAPPSHSQKVLLRQQQLSVLLAEVQAMATSLASVGSVLFLLGGDFNALREEFVYGTGDDFYSAPAVAAVQPALTRPSAPVPAPEPPLARLRAGALELLCPGVDGGTLAEVSRPAPAPGEVPCTRAGKSMVIDFIFAGTVNRPNLQVAAHRLASAEQSAIAADAATGIHQAVLEWGSDHLPVACNVVIGERRA